MRDLYKVALFSIMLFGWSSASADADVICALSNNPPVVDGDGKDSAWLGVQAVSTRDAVADIDHEVRCVHSDRQIFFLVRFPDENENRVHKPLVWNADEQRYVIGTLREDTLVLKWNMEPLFTDISLSADEVYRADIWYWKSARTDHAGFADDKLHIYSDQPLQGGRRLVSKSGRRFHLLHKGDEGRSAYKSLSPAVYSHERIAGYEFRTPEGSRADVHARGQWSNGWWTVEFSRELATGNPDDVQFATGQRYQFGISRYEIAGRAAQHDIEIPLFGSGEVGENLVLVLEGQQIVQQ